MCVTNTTLYIGI